MDKLESFRTTRGTCCKQILFSVSEDGLLKSCLFIGSRCSGGHQAMTSLCTGRHIDEVILKLKGIVCRDKSSCPDQLAIALEDYKLRKSQPVVVTKR